MGICWLTSQWDRCEAGKDVIARYVDEPEDDGFFDCYRIHAGFVYC